MQFSVVLFFNFACCNQLLFSVVTSNTNKAMRKIHYLFLFVILLSSCNFMGGRRVRGNGNLTSQSRSVGSFEGVHVLGGMDVIVSAGTDYAVKVEADENLQNYILTEKEGDALVLKTRNGYNLQTHNNMKVYLTVPSLAEVVVNGSGSLVSTTKLTANRKLDIDVTGSGDVKLDVDVPEVDAEATGSGNIILSGRTRNFDVEIDGSGEVKCFNLLSEQTKVDIAGSGSAQVYASKALDVSISGSGDVAYKGTPAINQHVSGSGSVRSTP